MRNRRKKAPVKKIITEDRLIVGLDMSITEPGICYSRSDDEYTCQTVKPPAHKVLRHPSMRFDAATDMVLETSGLKLYDSRRCYIALEDYAFAAVGKTFDIAECIGLLKWKMIVHLGIPPENFILISTGHLKMFVTEKGTSKKEVMIKEVYKRWGFDTNNDNEADAFGLWAICMAIYCPGVMNLTVYQKNIIEKVRKYNGR